MYFIEDCKGNTRKFTHDEIVENARKQANEGIKPMYAYNYGHGEYSEKGYLVVSMYGGCIVAIPMKDDKFHIIRGWQGDFVVQ